MKKRAMKKWIPIHPFYCYDRNGVCPWWREVGKTHKHKKWECRFGDTCDDDCLVCNEHVAYCAYLGVYDYGEYPLVDMCKICGQHEQWKRGKEKW